MENQLQNSPKPYKLNDAQKAYAKIAWEAFAASSTKKYIEFMNNDFVALPLLKIAMSYVYYRYPQSSNGLCLFDEILLKNSVVKGSKAARVIGNSIAETINSLDLVGDVYLFNRLRALADPKLKNPLLQITSLDEPMRNTDVEITEFGQRVLDKKGQCNPGKWYRRLGGWSEYQFKKIKTSGSGKIKKSFQLELT